MFPPKSTYLMYTLPIDQEEVASFAKRFWKPGEGIFLGMIPYSQLLFDYDIEALDHISNYFKNELYKFNPSEVPLDKLDAVIINAWEDYSKFVWLAQEYIDNGNKFTNPIGSHYNPRMLKNPIHPGGARNKIYKYLHNKDEEIYSFYFPTYEVKPNFLKNMKRKDPSKLVKQGYSIGLTPDHGSLIPHVMKGMDSIPSAKKEYQMRIYERFKTPIKIQSTHPMSEMRLDKFINEPNPKEIFHIEFKEYSTDAKIGAGILFGLGIEFENKYFKTWSEVLE